MRIRVAAFLLAFTTAPGPALPQSASAPQTVPAAPATGSATTSASGTAVSGETRQTFSIVNQTRHIVTTLNVSPAGEDTWGPDILGRDALGNGESAEISFPRIETQCVWDIQAIYAGGVSNVRNVNLCEIGSVALTAD